MAEQQNSGTGNTGNFGNQSTIGGGGASTQTAKDDASLTTTGGGESGSSATEGAGTLGNVTNKVKGLYQTAADSQVGQAAKDALGQVKENATSAIDDKKANIAQGLTSVADTLRQVGGSVKPPEGEQANKVAQLTTEYTETLSQQVEKLSGYLERQDLSGLMSDLEGFARRNPVVFLGGAFALGILAARFLKSTPSHGNPSVVAVGGANFDTTSSSLSGSGGSGGSSTTGGSTGETSGNPYGGVTIDTLGDKADSFGETSGALGSDAGSVTDFSTGSGAGSTGGGTNTGPSGTGGGTSGSSGF